MSLFPSTLNRGRSRKSLTRSVARWRLGCALVLAVLAALPFTAPFSTCNLAMLMGDSHTAVHLEQPLSVGASVDAPHDASPGPMLDEESFKDVTLAASALVPFLSSARISSSQLAPITSIVRPPLVALRL